MKRKKSAHDEDLRINPESRVCPLYDACSIRKFPVAEPEEMGVRVVDDCAEEHMQ